MAPEQLEGGEADARTDIFAFGAVLYEMVTGRRAFDGKSQASVISAIMSSDPPPVSSLQPVAPPALDQIVRTCLAKHPDERWQNAGDVARQLRWIAGEQSRKAVRTSTVIRPRYKLAIAATTAVLTLAAGAGVWLWLGERSGLQLPQRLSVVLPADHPVFIRGSPNLALAISPDGSQIVYVAQNLSAPEGPARRQLYRRSLLSREVSPLPGTEGATQSFFSPDGRWIGFFTTDGELKKVSVRGGRPITLLEKINGTVWGFGVWVGDTIVFGTPGSQGLRRVPSDGGSPEQLTTLDGPRAETAHLPTDVVGRAARIEAVLLDSRERRVIVENAFVAHYLNSGHLLFKRNETLLVAPFDPEQLRVTGQGVPVSDEPLPGDGDGWFPQIAVSPGGTLAYLPTMDVNPELGRVNRSGAFANHSLSRRLPSTAHASPDGQSIAFEVLRSGVTEIHLHDIARGTTTRLIQR
jgi:serine/threonine-protein kinase